jgi:Helix-hairpin-helix motif
MKWCFTILLLIMQSQILLCQEIPGSTEQQLENQTDADQGETEDDSFLQEMEQFKRHPLHLNTADAEELKQLRVITDLQIANLIAYRNLLGKLISIYELQAVPGWDMVTIKKILPFVTTANPIVIKDELKMRFRKGEHQLLLRLSQVMEKSKGYDRASGSSSYLGSPQRIFFRHRYMYKNLLQFGVVGDKDAGEHFFKGAQKSGFDFLSAHLFVRNMGAVKSLAFGDFTVNMGQGLIQWQGLAFKKSVDVMGVKRQSAVLKPYSSAGEFYFHRGAGITLRKGKTETTLFASLRKLNVNIAEDSASNEEVVSSFLTSGYNRTVSELADKQRLTQTSIGGVVTYRGKNWNVGVNGIMYQFSSPVKKRDEPYNLFAISGSKWSNVSIDYNYTRKNIHFFGEAAIDKNFNRAFVNGLLISADVRVDISLVQRSISKAYQSVNGNAFTENTLPTNETGLYTGITIRPAMGWRIDAYADIYKFPWLKYGVDAPSGGRDFLTQLTYTPGKQAEIYTRFRNESKQANLPDNTTETNLLIALPRQSWRTQINYKISPAITLRNRIEMVWYDRKGENKEAGFLTFIDVVYKPMLSSYGGILRLQYFETDGYYSRIYAYENDVLYSYSIPSFSEPGYRYYISLNADMVKNLSFWLRLAQTIYPKKTTIGSGLDEIAGNRRTEIKFQARFTF